MGALGGFQEHAAAMAVFVLATCGGAALAFVLLVRRARSKARSFTRRLTFLALLVWTTTWMAWVGRAAASLTGEVPAFDLSSSLLALLVTAAAVTAGGGIILRFGSSFASIVGGGVIGLGLAALGVLDALSFTALDLSAVAGGALLAIFCGVTAAAGTLFAAPARRSRRLGRPGLAWLLMASCFAGSALPLLRHVGSPLDSSIEPAMFWPFLLILSVASVAVLGLGLCAVLIDWLWAERLDSQAAKLVAALNDTSFGLTTFDGYGRLVLRNDRYAEIYDLSIDELPSGTAFAEVVASEVRNALVKESVEAVVAAQRSRREQNRPYENLLRLKDGRYILITTTPWRDGGWAMTHLDVTERHVQARELANMRNFLDAIIDHVPDPIVVRDAETHVCVLMNRAAEDGTGRSRAETIGKPLEAYYGAEQSARIQKIEREVTRSRRALDLGERVRNTPQGPQTVTARKIPVFGNDGEVHHILTITHDVTERRRQTEELRETRNFLDAIIEHVPDPIFVRDADNLQCVLINRAAERVMGQPRDKILGQPPEAYFPPERARSVRQHEMAVIARGTPHDDGEKERQTLSGPRVLASKKIPILDESGQVRYVISISHDVTKLKAQAEELHETRNFLDAIIEQVPDPIIVRDVEHRCVLVNHAAEEVLGTSKSALIGKTVEQQYPAKTAGAVRRHEDEVIANGIVHEFGEHTRQTPLGQRTFSSKKAPIFDGDGRVGYVLTLMHDVTERKQQTEELRETKSFLDMVIENVPVSILVRRTEDLRFAFINRAAAYLIGKTPDEVVGRSLSEVYPSPAATMIEAEDHRIIATGEAAHLAEQTVEATNGEMRTVSAQRIPIKDIAGKPKYIMTLVEDITDRTRQTRELAQIRQFLDMVIDSVPVGILVREVKGTHFELVNRAAEKIYGVRREDIIGKAMADVYPAATAAMIAEQDQQMLATGKPLDIPEQIIETPSGETRAVEAHRVPIRDADGRFSHLLSVVEDITQRKEAEARIAHMAQHDPLTDLPNRVAFNAQFTATLDRATAERDSFALLCLDLDRFKEVNDVYGHSVGDELLCRVGKVLAKAADNAFLARLGGDEFAIIASGHVTPASAARLGERLLDAVAGEFEINDNTLHTSLSVGIALYPSDGVDTTALLANADAALYRAKIEGRGTLRFFESDMDKRLREQRVLALDLRLAIERGEIHLHYQPQAHLDREVVGFEALLRWEHPTRGNISPDVFVPLAEESGSILEIGEWALREACREAASWPKPLNIAVNVSTIQFRHGDLVSFVHAVLLETGLAPARLEIEVTESVLIDDLPRALSILRRLKSLGVRIAMDDFGTGYSSLSTLQSFAFDKIKIDRSFIMNLETNPQSATIVRAVIALGRGLNMPVIAEGVETAKQLAFLVEERCDEVQGYLVGKPLPIDPYGGAIGRPASKVRQAS
jgi:diguanylate cyclase (GGDEF)-like protein/PAS domain S-box-containing protein